MDELLEFTDRLLDAAAESCRCRAFFGAVTLAKAAVDLLEKAGSQIEAAWARVELGIIYHHAGDTLRARAQYAQALPNMDPVGKVFVLMGLRLAGDPAKELEDLAEAIGTDLTILRRIWLLLIEHGPAVPIDQLPDPAGENALAPG